MQAATDSHGRADGNRLENARLKSELLQEATMSHQEDWQREVTAYHVAGHAVIRYELGFEPKSVKLSRSTEQYTDPLRGIKLDTDGSDRARQRLEKAIKISYAGPLAQRKFKEHSWNKFHGEADFSIIRELGVRVCGSGAQSGAQADAFLRWLELTTQEMVDVHWVAIERVAKRLLVHDRLAGAHISALIRGAYGGK